MIQDIFTVDWTQVRLRRAGSAVIAILIVAAFASLVGDTWSTVGVATLFALAMSGDGAFADRWPSMARYTVAGAAVGGLAYVSSDNALAAAAVFGLATYLGTLAAAAGPVSARGGLFLTIWAFLALDHGGGGAEPWQPALAFLAGGVIAIAITGLRLHFSSEDEAGEIDEPEEDDQVEGKRLKLPEQLGAAMRSKLGMFAILRTAAVMLAVVLGYIWFDTHALWAALTVIIVVKPSTGQTASIAVQRTLGTAIGASLAIAVAQVLPRGETAVAIAFVVCAFFMLAFMNANYTLFATFLTATLVFGQRLGQSAALEAGSERLVATLLGSAIGVAVMSLTIFVQSKDQSGAPAN